jgi:hypothetical protein
MTERKRHFDDLAGERRELREQMEQVRQESKTANPERRSELGWWWWGATKHLGRLADISLSRSFGEHRFIIEEWTKEVRAPAAGGSLRLAWSGDWCRKLQSSAICVASRCKAAAGE